MPDFIFDPLTGDPTILATKRSDRPDQTGAVSSIAPDNGSKETPKKKVNPFAKGNESMTPPTMYKDVDDWNVRVFENKYPLLKDHEIIVHSPSPDEDIEDFDTEQITRIIRAYLNRTSHFNDQEKEVIIFNNRGGKAGASLPHPHSQIVAAKGFPGVLEKEKESALHYFNSHTSCFWCDEIEEELESGERVVIESPHFIVHVPKACRWSYELRLVPKRHTPHLRFIDEPEINDLACVLKQTLIAYNRAFDRPDRNFWIHTSRYEPYHWHIGFIPHIKVFGALELGCGIWVSDKATSEDAAAHLRKFIN